MALINCNECDGEVSDRAPSCPHCGITLKKKAPIKLVLYLVYFVAIGYVVYTVYESGAF